MPEMHRTELPRSRHTLVGRNERALIVALANARRRNDASRASEAKSLLIASHGSFVRNAVQRKLPRDAVDDVVSAKAESALKSDFHGSTLLEFRAWLPRIAARRVVDFYRRRPVVENLDALEVSRVQSPEELSSTVVAADAIATEVARLSPVHRQVILRYVFADESASTVSLNLPGISESNVFKIAERFRVAARRGLEN